MCFFVEFQKASNTGNHKILPIKVEQFGFRGVSNKWRPSYLDNKQKYISIGGMDSETRQIMHCVLQGSVLGPMLCLTDMDLNVYIYFSTTEQFTNNTNLLYIELKRTNNLLTISRYCVPKELLIQIHYEKVSSHLTY